MLPFLPMVIIMARAAPALCDEDRAEDTLRELRRSSRCAEFRPPTAGELVVAEELFGALLAGRGTSECAALARVLRLRLDQVRHRDEILLVVAEEPGADCRGWGSFVFRRPGIAPDVLLQAPHCHADRFTGTIAQRAFLAGGARGVAFNGAKRSAPTRAVATPSGRSPAAIEECGEHAADVAHSEANLFQALTRAYARAAPQGLVVQIHGFSQERRSTAAGRAADIVASDGSARAPAWLRSLAGRLEASLDINVALFPDEVAELGATTNRQGMLLRASNGPRFLHLELSLPLRRRLLRESDLHRRLARCWLD